MVANIDEERPDIAEVVRLYKSVGWSAYTEDEPGLVTALAGSHRVFTARGEDGALIGLARTISDGHTIVHLQDILVSPARQRQGVGGALLDRVLDVYGGFRQFVLLTDGEPQQVALYESRGLTDSHGLTTHPVRAYVLFR